MSEGVYVEVHHFADIIRDNSKKCLIVFGFQPVDMRAYLRQGCNAGSDSVALGDMSLNLSALIIQPLSVALRAKLRLRLSSCLLLHTKERPGMSVWRELRLFAIRCQRLQVVAVVE